jgi:hypothetical protein
MKLLNRTSPLGRNNILEPGLAARYMGGVAWDPGWLDNGETLEMTVNRGLPGSGVFWAALKR